MGASTGLGLLRPGQTDQDFTAKQLDALLYMEPTKIKVDGINITYEGIIGGIQKSMLSKDIDSVQPHIRAFIERAVTSMVPGCDGTRLAEHARTATIDGTSIADACRIQISDLANWVRGLDRPTVAPLLVSLVTRSTPSSRSAWDTWHWSVLPAHCRVARRSAPR